MNAHLDGGGIRGVSELVILDKIMRRVQEKEGLDRIPKPCDYFHLMGGTSTGGLIAIMLGRLRMSTTEALAEYNNFARQIFRKKNRQISVSSQFREATLESIVRDVAKKYAPESSELMRDPNRTPRSWLGRAFVCARPSKDQDRGPLRIRAYPSDDDWAKDCKIWEAARATTAAPLYFKSISITSGNVIEQFIDPALGCNNPVAEVLDEAGEILDASCKLGCVLSLGTGTRPKSLEKAGGMGRNLQVFKLLKDYTTDSERTHSEMLRRFTDFPSTYFRFSVPGAAAKIGMAKHKKIGELTRMTEEYLESPEVAAEIEKIVDILCEGTTEGVTVGHVRYPNKNQIVMDKRRANAGGIASTLFTGRTEILERLSVFFSKREGNTGPRREFLLYGMGGVGKTQIALKFKQTMESEKRFGRVLWVDATDSTTIEECYNDIAVNLGVTGGTGKDRVLEWMNTTDEEWLLIMDNRNDDDQPITRYLPTMDKGNMLYTTRPDHIKQMLPGDAVAEVDKMEEQEAVTMLLKATRQPTDSPKFRAIGLPIVQELGCLPLAIDQAGAYIYMDGCYLGDYLALFLKHKQSMLKKPRYKGSSERNLPVYATFDLSHKVLASYSKGKRGLETAEIARIALKVLSFVCFYHDQGIMEETVKRAAEWRAECPVPKASVLGQGRLSLEDVVRIDQGHTWNPETFRDAVRLLESLSVVKRDRARTFSLHVLVHSWARDRMIDEERDSFSMSARSILYESIPFGGDSDDVLYRRRIAPHIRACEALVKHRSSEEKENVYLARRAAVTRDAGRLDDALKLWEEVVRERRFLEGPDSEHAIRFTYEMACTYLDAGDLLQAEAWLTEVLERADGIIPETD
ncbi:FabD/ lysophospholipase, partial [Rhypophila sp. PSN 637]